MDIPGIFSVVDNPEFALQSAWAKLDDDQPQAFLTYLLFDNNFKLQKDGFDFAQVSDYAKIVGSGQKPHERLSLDVTIQKEGFIYVYVSNLSDQNMDVYFDDLKVTHTYSDIVAGGDYYPFGLTIKDRQIEREFYRYGYQGQNSEKDEETGWNHFELREYDPVIGRWSARDPKRQFFSPYIGMGNNPTMAVDVTGGSASPIFDLDGNLLGTDNEGLKGEAIFMSAKDFEQGMSHESALNVGMTFSQAQEQDFNLSARAQAFEIMQTLPSRPDYNGYISLVDANKWWRDGNGEPLYVDASQINLMNVSVSDFNGKRTKVINFATPAAFVRKDPNTGLVYGTIKLTLLDPNRGTVILGRNGYLDSYDFIYDNRFWRNVANAMGSYWARKDLPAGRKHGVNYNIYTYGIGTIHK